MELEEEEAQVCRLCGQCESIYIDVFGEEGTKRFLGLKIHTKINILIDERDPLPKAICVQCLGKLEFVCDFQEECLRTQQVLRDRYNLPPLTDIAEIKHEDVAPSTSTNNNNIEKNLNSSAEDNVKEVEQRVLRTPKTQRSRRGQQQGSKSGGEVIKNNATLDTKLDRNLEGSTPQVDQTTDSYPTRCLRSRQNTETGSVVNNAENSLNTSIANRLRSHDSTCNSTENTLQPGNVANENNVKQSNNSSAQSTQNKQSSKLQDPHAIQIPTSAMNKLLTIVSASPDIEISVKESRNRNSDAEDISFTVQLCKKESDDVATVVRARVFPDQGSCLVDAGIVSLLQNQSSAEVNSIINSIINSGGKNPGEANDFAELEERLNSFEDQNPEELFRIDGEEICVDDNVEHVVSDSQNGYACKLCRKFYERKDKCTVHVKTHLGIKQYTCILCNAKFVCKSDVMKHIRCSHTNPRPIQCPKCPKRFKSKFYLTEHDNVHKGIRPYTCSDCGQSYHHKVSLQIHVKSHLPPQNLACEYCGKVFPYRTRLLSHIASVHLKNRRNFRCRFCYNLYSSLAVLNDHIKTRHATTHTCEVCGKRFKVTSKYKTHVLQHSNPKPYTCNICNNRYASKAFLNEHLLKHEGLRKHICQKCGARFAQASHLAAHRHVHGEKTHACPECGKKFNRRDNMQVHRKRHLEMKKTGVKQKSYTSTDEVTSATQSNEKIKEDDGLSHKVCLRCLGTLEFLCDFYDHCHQTQNDLIANQNTVQSKLQKNFAADKNKESGHLPVLKESRETEIYPATENFMCSNTNELAVSDACNAIADSNSPEGKILSMDVHTLSKPNAQTNTSPRKIISLSSFIENKENVCEVARNYKDSVNIDHQRISKRLKKSDVQNNAIESLTEKNDKQHSSALRRSGRKPKFIHVRNKPYKMDNQIKTKVGRPRSSVNKVYDKTNLRSNKRQCLRTICSNENSKSMETNVTSPVNYSIKRFVTLRKPTSTADTHVEESSKFVNQSLPNLLSDHDNSKSQSVTVKMEKLLDVEDSGLPDIPASKINQLVWTPKDVLLQKAEQPRSQKSGDAPSNASPPPGDEAETSGQRNSDLNSVQDYAYISAHPQSNCAETGFTDKSVNSIANLKGDSGKNTEEKQRQALEKVVHSSPAVKDSSLSSTDDEGQDKKREKFGKISELITDEQKKAIETYYKVDMSVVNEDKIQENLTVIDKKTIQCKICGLRYPRLDKCQVHIRSHLNMRPYQCKACDFATVTVSNVRCHIRKSHLKIKPFECYVCGKKYVTAVLLEEHLNIHTGARPFKCKVCNFASSSRQVLSYHNTTHKPVKDIICKVCGKQFYSRGRMRAHMFIHNKDKVVVCKLCSSYLSNAEALEAHNKNVHMRDYICNVCGKCFKSRKALHNHQNVHSAAKYKCTLCPNVYKSSHILKEHLLKHEGIRKYKCSVCEKSFAQQSHLAAHMAVHSEIRFHCPGCQRAFNRHDNMKIHTKRCEMFLANPELKELLTRRDRARSIIKSANGSVSESKDTTISQIEATNLNKIAVMKTDLDADKTDVKVEKTENEKRNSSIITNGDKTNIAINEDNVENCMLEEDIGDPALIINIVENVLNPDKF